MKKKRFGKILVIGLMILFVGTSVGASVVRNINGDKDKMNSIILSNENKQGASIRAWSDDFESYSLGQFLDGDPTDGGWKGWDDDPQFGAFVVDTESYSPIKSVEILDNADIVHEFTGYTSGQYRFIAWQYIPDDFFGSTYFILLSDYTDGGGQNNEWAVQIRFDADLQIAESEFDGINLPLITGKWVVLRCEINLNADWFQFYYDGDLLIEKAWTAGVNNDGGGILNIAAVDLFANAATVVYYDDLSLDLPQPLSCDADGPYEGNIDEDIEFDATVTGGIPPYSYHWDFGNGDTADVEDPVYAYSEPGVYTVNLTVTDDEQSNAFDETIATINAPPNAPTITGPDGGKAGTEYDFTFNAVDPDVDDVKYVIDWGDDTETETDFAGSGEDVVASHTWAEEGVYTITAYAEDSNGQAGQETTKDVNMPRSKAVRTSLFMRFLQNYPNMFPILQLLIQRFGLQ